MIDTEPKKTPLSQDSLQQLLWVSPFDWFSSDSPELERKGCLGKYLRFVSVGLGVSYFALLLVFAWLHEGLEKWYSESLNEYWTKILQCLWIEHFFKKPFILCTFGRIGILRCDIANCLIFIMGKWGGILVIRGYGLFCVGGTNVVRRVPIQRGCLSLFFRARRVGIGGWKRETEKDSFFYCARANKWVRAKFCMYWLSINDTIIYIVHL